MEPSMNYAPSLPSDVWQVLYACIMEQHVPFHVKRVAIQQFETALQAAQQPAQAREPE